MSFRSKMAGLPPVSVSSRVLPILPSKNSTDDKKAEIQAAIDRLTGLGGGLIELFEGEYHLSSALALKDKVAIASYRRRSGRLKPMTGWTGGADDPGNALVKADGAVNTAKLNTTLSALARKDATQIVITAVTPGPLAAGDYLLIEGYNSSSNSSGDSDGASVILSEIVRVGSSYVSGTTVPLETPLTQYHASGVAVKAVTPILEVGLHDLEIDAAGGSLAVGLLHRYSQRLEVSGLKGKGFSRALVNLIGSKRLDVEAYSRGEANSIVFAQSIQAARIEVDSDPAASLRHHASGIPRGLISFRFRCTNVQIPTAKLHRGCVGVQVWGGKNISFGEVLVHDMNSDRADTQWQTVGEGGGSGSRIGSGINGGAGPLGIEEFGHGISFGKVVLDHCRHPAKVADGCQAYIHDWLDFYIGDLQLRNHGHDGITEYIAGVVCSDVVGHIDRLKVGGAYFGLRTENATAAVIIDDYNYDGAPGSNGTNAGIGISLNHTTSGPTIRRLRLTNAAGGFVRFGSAYADPLYTRIEAYLVDAVGDFSAAIPAYNNTGTSFAVGELVEFSGTFTLNSSVFPAVITPTGAKKNMGVVVVGAAQDPGTGVLMVCPLPNDYAYVEMANAGAVAVGDLIESQNGLRTGLVNNGSAAPLGKALSTKAALTNGKVRVGPV